MNITVTAAEPENNTIKATINVAAADVDAAIAKTYKDIAARYNFQGFRRGRAPRPVIDNIVGKQAVRAQASNDLLSDAEPQMLDELDLVPVTEVSFGEDPAICEDGKDYVVDAYVEVRPTAELDGYDAPAIDMPPEEATDAEVELQIKQILSYQTSFKDVEDERPVAEGDYVSVDIENVEGAERLAGTNRMLRLDGTNVPAELQAAIVGMAKGETKDVSWDETTGEGDDAQTSHVALKVTVNAIREEVTPELDDAFAKDNGFDTLDELRDAIKEEIEQDKKSSLPSLKEDRVVEAVGKRLVLDEVPANYKNQVFQELAQEFLTSLQRQGLTLDNFLAFRGVSMDDFLADLQAQADERARQSLALDALVRKLGIEATEDEVLEEFKKSGAEDPEALMAQWKSEGRLPAVRESVRRTKALDWLVENAEVTIKDEIAESEDEGDDAAEVEDAPATDAEVEAAGESDEGTEEE